MKPIIALCCIIATGNVSNAASPSARLALLKEDFQILQRDADDAATFLVALPADAAAAGLCEWSVSDGRALLRSGAAKPQRVPGVGMTVRLASIPVGGPYTVTVSAKSPARDRKTIFHNVLVGDIWILGGQSNMFGIDRIQEELPALPYINLLDPRHLSRDAHWCAGLPPIHRIPEPFATYTLRTQHADWSADKIRRTIASGVPVGGIDCSYFFARKLYAESGVPIGLIPCAIGAALAYWDPAQRDRNRYGFMQHHVETAGGRVKGLLFFQGEQDAIFGEEQRTVTSPSLIQPTRTYARQFQTFVEAFRKDCGDEDSPVIFAQICRHHNGRKEKATGWEIIREAQRLIPESVSHTHCVPTVDLDVIDGLHLDYASLKRVGLRMAYLALPYVKKSVAPRSEIKLQAVRAGMSLKPTIVVEFGGVTGKLGAPGRATGFSLKDKATGEVLDWIYKVEFDPVRPNAVVLHVAREPHRAVTLYYAAGAAPYANITDQNDMPLPAFGPVELEPEKSAPAAETSPPTPAGMVLIPAGKAALGTSRKQREMLVERYRIHPDLLALQTERTVDVAAFFIDRCEVTNRAYREFVEATGHRPPLVWLDAGYPAELDDYPLVGIDFEDAVDYARWAGKRLPTEAEWEKAARGTDGRLWPWGNEWDPAACRCDDSHGGPMRLCADRVGSHAKDRSPYGVMDMAGNVMEWVQGTTAQPADTAFLRGGGFPNASPVQFLCATRIAQPRNHGNVCYIGFRCAMGIAAARSASLVAAPRREAGHPLVPGKSPFVRPPRAADPSLYRKESIRLLPVFDLDPGRKHYRNAMSAYMPVSKTGKEALARPTPCRVEVRVPYLPDDRFNIFFENMWGAPDPLIPQFSDDSTVARFAGTVPKTRVQARITVTGGLDSVDVDYEYANQGQTGTGPCQELCFNALFAPNFRDHDGTRTFLTTSDGLTPRAALWHHVKDRLWLEGYDVGEKPPRGGPGPSIRGPLILTVSRDGQWLVAVTSLTGPPVRLFNNREYSCLHCYPISTLTGGERKHIKQRIYFLKGSPEDLAARLHDDLRDMPDD